MLEINVQKQNVCCYLMGEGSSIKMQTWFTVEHGRNSGRRQKKIVRLPQHVDNASLICHLHEDVMVCAVVTAVVPVANLPF